METVGKYWKERFGEKVYRISIDAGFTCPNRDGSKGRSGCTFCDERGARPHYVEPYLSVEEQIKKGKKRLKKRGINKFIAYFQAYTNTYAPLNVLEQLYLNALSMNDIVGVSLSTRPDCINPEILNLIEEVTEDKYTVIELGVQTVHQKSLDRVNRCHSVENSRNAVEMINQRDNIELVEHIILGLPGETENDMIETAETISEWGLDGIKLHHLYVVKDTHLAEQYKNGEVKVFETPEEYTEIASRFIQHLPYDIIIHRFSGYSPKEYLIAPSWTSNRHIARNLILGKRS